MSTITCAISKLPILPGEEMVCLPLIFKSTYQCEKGIGRIETKSMMTYTTDAFELLGLGIKGVAGHDGTFQEIEKDGNTSSLESYFEMSIESILESLTRNESVNHQELSLGIVVFVKRSIFDYLSQPVAETFFRRQSLGEKYDELMEGIEKWNVKLETMSEDELSRIDWLPDNPLSYFAKNNFSLYRSTDEILFNFHNIYKKGLLENSIRESLIETFNFIVNSYEIGYYFFPTLKGEKENALHHALLDASRDILEGKIARFKEDEEEWD